MNPGKRGRGMELIFFLFGGGIQVLNTEEIWQLLKNSLLGRKSSGLEFSISHVRFEFYYSDLVSQTFLIARIQKNCKSWGERKGDLVFFWGTGTNNEHY